MLANNWSPPLCLLALEDTEPAEEAIKRSITSNDETSINDDVKIKWRKCMEVE